MGSKAVAALGVHKAHQVLPIHSKVLERCWKGAEEERSFSGDRLVSQIRVNSWERCVSARVNPMNNYKRSAVEQTMLKKYVNCLFKVSSYEAVCI